MTRRRLLKPSAAPDDFDAFCRQEHRRLVEMLSLYCGDRTVGEEMAQEAFIKAGRDWSKVKKMDNPRAWLRRVAINLANSYFRRKGIERRAKATLQSRTLNVATNPDLLAGLALRDALATLPARQRLVLVLRYFDDLSVAQVAEVMDCPQNTVRSLGRRALESLRAVEGIGDIREARHA